MSRLTAALVSIALASIGLLAPTAHAQTREQQARTAFDYGVNEMEQGRPQNAVAYFQRSYDLSPRAATACNMALALERTNQSCDSMRWYQQCASIDGEGRFRDHAQQQARVMASRCPQPGQTPNPFVSGPQTTGTTPAPGSNGGVQIVESGQPGTQSSYQGPGPDHAWLAPSIIGLVLGAGALVGAIVTADLSNQAYDDIQAEAGSSESPTTLLPGSPDANAYNDARTYRDASIGLSIAAGLLGGVGLVFLIVDLSQPGVFGPSARRDGPHLALSPRLDGGGEARLRLSF